MASGMRYGATKLEVPSGFENIIWLISQEVLRVQPEDTVKFISNFLSDLMDIRNETGFDPALKGDMMERVKQTYADLRESRERQNLAKGRAQIDS